MTASVREIQDALEGTIPSVLATRGADGLPNVTYMSQVLVVDDSRVAVSDQFFRKTLANLRDDPRASLMTLRATDGAQFRLRLRYQHSVTEGDVFEQLDARIAAIASMVGMGEVFKLRSAALFDVLGIEQVPVAEPE